MSGSIKKISLLGLTMQEMGMVLQNAGASTFREKQLWRWIYHKGVKTFGEMHNIPKDLRHELEKFVAIERPHIVTEEKSRDGTRKWLLRFDGGQEAEMVFIPEKTRGTLCISSQIGCTLTCRFCHTGTQRLVRNLTADEIVGQVMVARDALNDWNSLALRKKITNIVLMGMGEPLYNFDNVAKAMKIIMDPDGIAFSRRKITLSTSGVVPMMAQCGEELKVNLAVSLHATNNALRNELVPLNKKYPLEDLLEACRQYPNIRNSRRITFEYVMLKDVNDSLADAKALVQLIKGIPAKVNLIPFNPWPGSPYERSDDKAIAAFADVVVGAGYASPVRASRGDDILAACGQLKSASERQRKSLGTPATPIQIGEVHG